MSLSHRMLCRSRILLLLCISLLWLSSARAQWQSCNTGLGGGVITSLTKVDTVLLAATINHGVLSSSDAGQSWVSYVNAMSSSYVFQLSSYKHTVFAATDLGLYRSSDAGKTWSFVGSSLPQVCTGVFVDGDTLFCSSDGGAGLYMSVDGGLNWASRNFGLGFPSLDHHCIAREAQHMMVGTYGRGTYFSLDRGANWTNLSKGLSDSTVTCVAIHNSVCYAGTLSGLFRSTDFGANWQRSNMPVQVRNIEFILAVGSTLFCASDGAGVMRSTDNGLSWTVVDPEPGLTPVCAYFAIPDLFVGTTLSKLRASDENGVQWSLRATLPGELYAYSVFLDQSRAFCGINGGGLFRSTNDGTDWTASTDGLYTTGVLSMIRSGADLVAGASSNGVFLSSDDGQSWVQRSTGLGRVPINAVTENNGSLFAAARQDGLYSSTDRAQHWSRVNTIGLNDPNIVSLVVQGGRLFAATGQRGVFSSSDNGSHWVSTNNGLSDTRVSRMVSANSTLYVMCQLSGVFASSNNGTNWSRKSSGLSGTVYYAIAAFADYVLVASDAGIFLSTDKGESWTEKNCGLQDYSVLCLAMDATRAFAGTSTGMIRSIPFARLLERPVKASVQGPTSVCPNIVLNYHANRDEHLAYKWTASNGTIASGSTDSLVQVVWDNSSNLGLKLIETNTISGCADTLDYKVQLSLNNLHIVGDSLICNDATKQYSLSVQDATIRWTTQNATIVGSDSDASVTVTWNVSQNTGQLRAIVRANNGGCLDTILRPVQIIHEPNPHPHISGNQAVCADQAMNYSVQSVPGHRYRWIVYGGTVQSNDTSAQISVTWQNTSTTVLQLLEWSPSGCMGSDIITIFVGGRGIDISGDFNPCNLDTVTYTSTVVSGVQKNWKASTGTIVGSATGDSVRIAWGTNNFLRRITIDLHLPGGCSSTLTKALGLPNTAASLELPDIKLKVNDQPSEVQELPLVLRSAHCLSANYAPDSVSYTVRLNKTMFLPVVSANVHYSDAGNWRTIRVGRKLGALSASDTVFGIAGYVLLGDSLSTPLYLENLSWLDSRGLPLKVVTQLQNGKLSLEGVADDYAGLRLLTRATVSAQILGPNPADDYINVELGMQQESAANAAQLIELEIVNALGSVVAHSSYMLRSTQSVVRLALDAQLSPGTYALRIRSALQEQAQVFQLIR